MYFLRIGKLSKDLKNNLIDQNEAFKYFFGLVILETLLNFPKYNSYINLPKITFLLEAGFHLLFIFIIIIFLTRFYIINLSGDNKNFLTRLIPLIFVTKIYGAIFGILIFTVIATAIFLVPELGTDVNIISIAGISIDIISLIFDIILGILIARKLK